MTLDMALLDILVCPVTRLPLKWLPAGDLERLNRAIVEGEAKYRDGSAIDEPVTQALVTRDGKLAYPVRDGVPVLLEEYGIELAALGER